MDSIIPILAISKNLRLASLCSGAARFESHLVGNPEDGFSRDKAHFMYAAAVEIRPSNMMQGENNKGADQTVSMLRLNSSDSIFAPPCS